MSTPRHCPGFERYKHLESFVCKCPSCGKEMEVFSDEFDRKHDCRGCGREVDFSRCNLEGSAYPGPAGR